MAGYEHRALEAKWQTYWAENQTFATPSDRTRPKYYVLDMFPYPSGVGLHVGHPKGYVATDVVARARRMLGYNVLHVMGWDSFGLPAERQAVREDISPQQVTERNIATFKRQLTMLGLSYDWSRELATSDPSYYKWTQWIFARLFERGLAFEAEVPVNWCPALGTVLANEEVKDGVYIETGDAVERRSMRQWMLKITDYAESLLATLGDVNWPEGIKKMQQDWIGRSEGATVRFQVDGSNREVEIFTTRPDTLFGCTYLVLAPEHPLVEDITAPEHLGAVNDYREQVSRRSDRERTSDAADAPKTGVFTGASAVNPINGERVPIWIADYVLASYGTGAVFACPAHDERDHAFARTFDLPIRQVVLGGEDVQKAAYTGDGPHINSGFLDGLDNAAAISAAIERLRIGERGERTITYRLRDWLFSRQRYWGEPVPVIHVNGETRLLPDSSLPVELPRLDDYRPTGDGQPPLARAEDWLHTTDPVTGEPALRETNTMPQWAGSCWYYLRFIDPHNDKAPWDPEEEKYWMPVDLYVGGAEHATLHLLYARFWHQVLHDLGYVSTREPFQRLFNQGMIHGQSYRDARGKYYYRREVEERDGAWYTLDGVPVTARREKMSKSKYNVVTPEDMCEEYGAESLRLYELFMSPLEDGGDWETSGVAGCRRFLDRVWRVATDPGKLVSEPVEAAEMERALHGAMKRVREGVESLRFNTAISDMMVFINEATKADKVPLAWFDAFVRILAPFAPHIAEELWRMLGHSTSVAHAALPEHDEAKLKLDIVTIAVQVNGKMRGSVEVPADADKSTLLAAARAEQNVARYLEGATLRREIVVPGRLVNFVVG
ncbi:MAG: leucine--tRNA ligase [Pseudomonadales bacterium]